MSFILILFLFQWDLAVEKAEEYKFPQIEVLLSKYANEMLQQNRKCQAVQLYRKANKHTEAAKLLAELAKEVGKQKVNPLRAKKLFVLSALEVERYQTRMLDTRLTQGIGGGIQSTMQTLQTLIDHDAATGESKDLDDPWHGAEAYHFWILSQRQFMMKDYNAAMRTAIRLQEYEDVLDPKDIYSLLALIACQAHCYGQASKAFIKLETLEGISKEDKEKYRNLALSIFTKYLLH